MGKTSRLKREFRTIERRLRRAREGEAAPKRTSPPPKPELSPWAAALEADGRQRANLNGGVASFSSVERGLRRVAAERDEWAGIPMPLDGETLVVEPTYPYADGIAKINQTTRRPSFRACSDADVDETTHLRNSFWSWRWRSDIEIWETGGKIKWGLLPGVHGFGHALQTLGCSDAWSLETEQTALGTLRSLVTHRAFRQYLLTGTFIESSKRSGLAYMFRRLRPTVAITFKPNDEARVLACLCLHPIAYYSGSWAGAMTPTDDVIAHLMLMRGDEPMFWRRANQHPAWRPEAGL